MKGPDPVSAVAAPTAEISGALTAEWAVEGKHPGTRDDYRILACSEGTFRRDDFAEIRGRYTTGTPGELPQVTLGWVGAGDNAHLVLAVQEWTDGEDATGRRIAMTRYFCVPYAQAAARRVTYEALHRALTTAWDGACGGRTAPSVSRRLILPEPGGKPEQIANRLSSSGFGPMAGTATVAAALLLTGRPVCVTGGEAIPWPDRLRFMDMVAALLPYGMRTRLTASTWSSSTSRNRLRLSFARHVPADAVGIGWNTMPANLGHQRAERYLRLLVAFRPKIDLVTGMARMTEPLGFTEAGLAQALEALDRLVEAQRVVPLVPSRPGGTASAERISPGRYAVGDRPLLTVAHMRRVIEDTAVNGVPPESVIAELRAMVPAEPLVTLTVAGWSPRAQREDLLSSLPSAELVKAVAQGPYDTRQVSVVCEELLIRGHEDGRDADEIAAALGEHRYLVDAVWALHPGPGGGTKRFDVFRGLLTAAYGRHLERRAFEEVLRGLPRGRSEPLLAAAVDLYGEGAGDAVVRICADAVLGAGLDDGRAEQLRKLLLARSTAGAPAGRQRKDGRGNAHRWRRFAPWPQSGRLPSWRRRRFPRWWPAERLVWSRHRHTDDTDDTADRPLRESAPLVPKTTVVLFGVVLIVVVVAVLIGLLFHAIATGRRAVHDGRPGVGTGAAPAAAAAPAGAVHAAAVPVSTASRMRWGARRGGLE